MKIRLWKTKSSMPITGFYEGFLWFPKIIKGELRWLRRAKWYDHPLGCSWNREWLDE